MAFQTKKLATKRRTDSPEARRQQRERRRVTLFKKACEYSLDCDADVYIAIRIHKDDQIFTFNSDSTGEWPLPEAEIVRHSLLGGSLPMVSQ
jgi:SRF-type transcription factor (DNA-binding and dimerisation domain)